MKLNILVSSTMAVLVVSITLFVQADNKINSIWFWIAIFLFVTAMLSWKQAIKEADVFDNNAKKRDKALLDKLDVLISKTDEINNQLIKQAKKD